MRNTTKGITRKYVTGVLILVLTSVSLFTVLIPINQSMLDNSIGRVVNNTGQQNVLVIPVFFSDVYPSHNIDEIHHLMQGVDDYTREVSYGKTWLEVDVLNWVFLNKSLEYYGTDMSSLFSDDASSADDSYTIFLMARDAIQRVDSEVDFRLYDRIVIYHSGYARQSYGSAGDSARGKWPDTCNAPVHIITDELTYISSVSIVAEYQRDIPSIGSICHEMGHDYGADDLYHNDPYGPDIGRWCLMSSGNYLNESQTPCHMCAYTKLDIGFLGLHQVLPIVNGTYEFELSALSIDSEGFYAARYNLNQDGSRYFLVESRKQVGFDSAITRPGVVVYIIDESKHNQDGRVLIADDERFSRSQSAYGPGEFFIDQESGFGLKVLNETDNGYLIQASTYARLAWQRKAEVFHGLEECQGSVTTLYNGTMFIAVSGWNYDLDVSQVIIYKSSDDGLTWTQYFETPDNVNRRNPVLVVKRESFFSLDEKPYLFCEAEFTENHTIEAWDIYQTRSYNLTYSDTDARSPSVTTHGSRFFIAFEIMPNSRNTVGIDNTAIGFLQTSSLGATYYNSRIIYNSSSPRLSPMTYHFPYGASPYMVYVSGPNSTFYNEVWFESFSGDKSIQLHSGNENVTNPQVAINDRMNLTMAVFEEWTRISHSNYRRDGRYVMTGIDQENLTILDSGRIQAAEPLQSTPLVTWGIDPFYGDVFYVGSNNGTTCCTIHQYNMDSIVTERTMLHAFPQPEMFTSHIWSNRWTALMACELVARTLFVSTYSYDDERSQYHYAPIYVTPQETRGVSLVTGASIILLFSIPGLTLALSNEFLREKALGLDRQTLKVPIFLFVLLIIAIIVNYAFAMIFSSLIVLRMNIALEFLFVFFVVRALYRQLFPTEEEDVTDEIDNTN